MTASLTTPAPGRVRSDAPRGGASVRARRRLSVHATYLLPAWLLVAAVVVVPLGLSVWMSLHNETMLRSGRFIGLENYTDVLTGDFWPALGITLVFSLAAIAVQVPIGLGLAMVLNRELRGTQLYRSVLLLPMLLTPVAVGLMWRLMLNADTGVINGVAGMLHLPALNWLGDRTLAVVSVVLVDAWQNIPFVMLLSLAGLQSLPDAPLEAAAVDGATGWQSFWHITLPMLTPVLGVVVMIRIIESIKLFDIIYILTQGGPGTATQNLSLLNYRVGFSFMNTGQAAALGIVICVVLIPVFWLQKKVNEQ
ncbi:MAG: sugar ABC transporter permease [Actinobacteria bacterium]|nr:sugar ABC transporter permease [Actinomycetota bacterium]